MKPLYVICTVFNPRRFQSRIRLYNNFAKWVADSKVNLLTVEVAFGERPFTVTTPDNPWNLQLRSRYEIWQKERALNLGLQHLLKLDPDWKYVAWMDTDIILTRADWADETVHLLQHYAIIQMFSEGRNLDYNYEIIWSSKSLGYNFEKFSTVEWGPTVGITNTDPYIKRGHPGLAWAFRREELNKIGGWLDICVNGSADLHMVGCFTDYFDMTLSPNASVGYRNAIKKYGDLCTKYVRRNWSYMTGGADHYYHGRANQRGYDDRWKMLDKYQFDPYTDLIIDLNGLYKWNLDDPRVMGLAVEVRKSLASRNEDSTS
jgi:hypothetical protein